MSVGTGAIRLAAAAAAVLAAMCAGGDIGGIPSAGAQATTSLPVGHASPAATTKVVPTKGLDAGGGPVVRAGQVWLASTNGLQSVNPRDDAVSSHGLSDIGTVALDGPLAVDKSGDLWMDGYYRGNRRQLIERYAPATGKLSKVAFPKACDNGGFQDFAISDGHIWLGCITPGLDFVRRTTSGGWDVFAVPAKYNYTEIAFVPGPDGSIWTTTELVSDGQAGLLEVTSGGAFRFFADPAGQTSWFLTGDGTSVVDALYCSSGRGVCFDAVTASGALRPLATGPESADNTLQATAAIDPSGNFWIVMIGQDLVKSNTGKFFFEITPKGTTKAYRYSVPAKYAHSVTGVSGAPAFAAGSVWAEINNAVDFANGTTINGQTLRLNP